MGWTKNQFVEAALEEIGISSYVFDLQPEQVQSSLRRLDAMIASWNGEGIHIGYPLPSSPEFSDVTAETNVPDSANEAIITNLAVRIAPSYGKVVTMETKVIADNSYRVLEAKATRPAIRQIPANTPAGAGNKCIGSRRVFLYPPEQRIETGDGGYLDY